MLHSIKHQPNDFNLLYLNDGELMINSIKCYSLSTTTKNMEEGKIHLNTRSIIIQPNDINSPLLKLKYSENLAMKIYTVDEILNFYNLYLESSNANSNSILKDNMTNSTQPTYLQKSSNYKKLSGNVLVNSNFQNFLNSYNQDNMSIIGSIKDKEPTSQKEGSKSNLNTKRQSAAGGSYNFNFNKHKENASNINQGNQGSGGTKNELANTANSLKNTINFNNNNNNNVTTSTLFSLKIKNFGEIINRAIKEVNTTSNTGNKTNTNINNSIIHNNNVNTTTPGKTYSVLSGNLNNNNNNINLNANTSYSSSNNFTNFVSELNHNATNPTNINNQINNTKIIKKSTTTTTAPINANNIVDLVYFFQENNLNFLNFCEAFQYIQNNYLKDEKFNTKYQIMLIKINRSHSIMRVPTTVYDINLIPKSYFIIVEAEDNKLKSFLDDRKFVMETLHKFIFDEREMNQFINKKVQEVSDNVENKENVIKSFDVIDVGMGSSKFMFDKNDFTGGFQTTQNNQNVQKSENVNNIKIIFKCKAIRLLPEGLQHGLFLIYNYYSNNNIKTSDHLKYIEFKPVTNNYKGLSLKIKLNRIQSVVTYRYLYKNQGLNVFLYQSSRSKIFVFENDSDYNFVNEYLNNEENSVNINKSFTDIKYHTELWSNGLMSNYDYLLYLNFMSSRSFSDLSQYPVFPWIITNYEDNEEEFDISEERNYRDLSKPVGALNPEKFEKFSKKYLDQMFNYSQSEPPYLYGTHYSTPAYVIYFLTRAFPQFQLQIQNGSYGPADRMLNSLRDCWNYIYSNTMGNEVMELIPDFFHSDGEFLMNIHNIQLSKPKNSEIVINDIQLPKWAKTPNDFISICRAALESDFVSSNINNWIDLIFGYNQKGKNAEAHDNVFYYITYDSYNYDDFPEDKKAAAFTQILQFGQTPKQLFVEPHPKKKTFDMLNYQIISNPKEMMDTIDKYKKENEKLENSYKKLIDSKFMEKQRLINEYKEIEKKRNDKIQKLKESLVERENSYKDSIDKMIKQNSILKENFDSYDISKDKFYQDMIDNFEVNHRNDIKKDSLNNYIKSLETSINKYKIKEMENIDQVDELNNKLEKQEVINEKLINQIENLKRKLRNIPNLENLDDENEDQF